MEAYLHAYNVHNTDVLKIKIGSRAYLMGSSLKSVRSVRMDTIINCGEDDGLIMLTNFYT